MKTTLKVAVLQGADLPRKEIMRRLEITEVEAKMCELRLERARDGMVLGVDDE